jgi:hypothetical protein
MHSHLDRIRNKNYGLNKVTGVIPSSICDVVAVKKQHTHIFGLKSFDEVINAGRDAGVFFGRLIRPFGVLPSGRISGPSAEFISVTRLRSTRTAHASSLCPCSTAVCADE